MIYMKRIFITCVISVLSITVTAQCFRWDDITDRGTSVLGEVQLTESPIDIEICNLGGGEYSFVFYNSSQETTPILEFSVRYVSTPRWYVHYKYIPCGDNREVVAISINYVDCSRKLSELSRGINSGKDKPYLRLDSPTGDDVEVYLGKNIDNPL